MYQSSFFIVGKHAVIEALKNPNRKVLRLFITEESKKTIHRESPRKNLIKNIKVFDIYEGENIPEHKKSIALNVTIQSSEKTLTEKDLEKINKLIISTVENKTGAKLRS